MQRALAILIITIVVFGATAFGQHASPPKVNWIEKPTGEDIAEFYPETAAEQGVNGGVLLCCQPQIDGRVKCAPGFETPSSFGFGSAAMKVSRAFKMSDADAALWQQANKLVEIRLQFNIAESQPPSLGAETGKLPKDVTGICAKVTQEQINTASAALDQVQPNVNWITKPNGNDFARFYPIQASRDGVSGAAVLCCLPEDDGHVKCASVVDGPKGYEFGEAAVRISREFQMSSEDVARWRRKNEFVEIPIRFVIYDSPDAVNAVLTKFMTAAKGICAKVAQSQLQRVNPPAEPAGSPAPPANTE